MTKRDPLFNLSDYEDDILEWIADGKPLREWCRQPDNPGKSLVYQWLDGDEAFSGRFARARREGADALAEECLEIADDARNDWIERNDDDGSGGAGYELNGDHIQRSRLRVDTRLKLLAKWFPQTYGDRVTHVGDKDADPVQVEGKGGTPQETLAERLESTKKAVELILEARGKRDGE